MKRVLFINVWVILTFAAQAVHHPVFLITVPKSGTHLAVPFLQILLHKRAHVVSGDRLNTQRPMPVLLDNEFFVDHVLYSPEATHYIEEHNFKGITIYRDPRDQVISLAYFLLKSPNIAAHYPSCLFEPGHLDDLIMYLITLVSPTHYKAFLPWKDHPNFHAVRFESLIGPKGGGTEKEQREEIVSVAAFLDVTLTDELLEECIKGTYGVGATFRKGQIGSWRDHFTPEHKATFKAGPLEDILVSLGYEKDHNW